jgi:hypothetical protein
MYDGEEPKPIEVIVHDHWGLLAQRWSNPRLQEKLASQGEVLQEKFDSLDDKVATLLFSKFTDLKMSWRNPDYD